ncbi:MAG TPA: NAD/NADP octopine/nopaline dehydrogenase family protein [Symbiobacteriaceae bacterium]|nr:NAD/NADP octopine/nopaline dehydrogenase family protein [Symbiobacteriaceae bacterium]
MVPTTVAVLGAGNGGKAMAADLTLRGFAVRLYDRFPEAVADVQSQGGIMLQGSARSGFAPIATATSDLAEAVTGARVIVIVVPAFAHAALIGDLVPLLSAGQTVLFTPGYLSSVLLRRQLSEQRPGVSVLVAETCSLPYACRLIGPAEVGLRGVKQALDVAACPAADNAAAVRVLLPLFPILTLSANVIEVALGNPNPVSHVPTCLLNYGRMEGPRTSEWHDFEQWVTPSIHKLSDRLDAERLAVLAGLGLHGIDQEAWSLRAYGGKAKDPLTTKGQIPANAMAVPERYITEDVPMGLVPLEALGRLAGVPTPVATVLISLASELHDRDYRQTGRSLRTLGWHDLSAAEILKQVTQTDGVGT